MSHVIDVTKEIKIAQKSSILHTIVEKIAYYLHTRDSERNQDANWFEAQDQLNMWLDCNFEIFIPSLKGTLEGLVEELRSRYIGTDPHYDFHYVLAKTIVYNNELFLEKKRKKVA